MATAALPLIEGIVTLGIQLGSELVPVIKGAITSIKQDLSKQGTVVYTVVITADQAELLAVQQQSIADLVALNAELVKQNAPALTVPAAPPAAP